MFAIWIIGVIVIGIIISYLWGREDMDNEFVPVAFFGTLFWPVLVALALIVAPFAIPFVYGLHRRKKANQQSKNV